MNIQKPRSFRITSESSLWIISLAKHCLCTYVGGLILRLTKKPKTGQMNSSRRLVIWWAWESRGWKMSEIKSFRVNPVAEPGSRDSRIHSRQIQYRRSAGVQVDHGAYGTDKASEADMSPRELLFDHCSSKVSRHWKYPDSVFHQIHSSRQWQLHVRNLTDLWVSFGVFRFQGEWKQ
jgi:hypothetical protein